MFICDFKWSFYEDKIEHEFIATDTVSPHLWSPAVMGSEYLYNWLLCSLHFFFISDAKTRPDFVDCFFIYWLKTLKNSCNAINCRYTFKTFIAKHQH